MTTRVAVFLFRRYDRTYHGQDPSGTWRPFGTGKGRSAIVTCPDCRQEASLRDHSIDTDGRVHPALMCPRVGCGFYRLARLEDWP